jgi:cell wall assembly regulator SMI1
MNSSWFRIHKWLNENYPEGISNLSKPADPENILRLSTSFGYELPHSFKSLLSTHNE